jgi:hypothetical protein
VPYTTIHAKRHRPGCPHHGTVGAACTIYRAPLKCLWRGDFTRCCEAPYGPVRCWDSKTITHIKGNFMAYV